MKSIFFAVEKIFEVLILLTSMSPFAEEIDYSRDLIKKLAISYLAGEYKTSTQNLKKMIDEKLLSNNMTNVKVSLWSKIN